MVAGAFKHMSDAIDRFAIDLDPMLVERVRSWGGHRGLAPMVESLRTQTDRRRFMDIWVEAMVADRLAHAGWSLRAEVETPSGRTCDLRVSRGETTFYLHLKRLDESDKPARQLVLSPRLRVLEQIARPYLVRIRWREDLDDMSMQHLVVRASGFLHRARIGEELTVRDDAGIEVGGVRVVGPWEGDHVSLAIGLPGGFDDRTDRIRGLLMKAYEQFMPRAQNVILVAGSVRIRLVNSRLPCLVLPKSDGTAILRKVVAWRGGGLPMASGAENLGRSRACAAGAVSAPTFLCCMRMCSVGSSLRPTLGSRTPWSHSVEWAFMLRGLHKRNSPQCWIHESQHWPMG